MAFSKFQFKVNMVLSLTDGYDGKMLSGSGAVFEIDGENILPVVKPEGYYVFYNIEKNEFDLKIKYPLYTEVTRKVDISVLDRSSPIIPVVLEPGREVSLGQDALKTELTVKDKNNDPVSGFEVCVIPLISRGKIKYSAVPGEKNTVKLFDPASQLKEGAYYAVVNSEEERAAVFRLNEIMQNNVCRIDCAISGFENGELVSQVRHGISDESGRIYLPVKPPAFAEGYLLCYKKARRMVFKKIVFDENNRYSCEINL